MKKKIRGNLDRPRLCIFKSNKHIYAQAIDDISNRTITASSSICPILKKHIKSSGTCETAKIIGEDIANKLKKKGIKYIVFDRNKNIYHGRIKALADAARNKGIIF
uniref:Large ribosomal subunit protein uL18c n=1 Tax=Rhodogorgon sp. TaxID=2485824 RepID=A0A3G3MHX1_9FLOR|nr:ribosomal protein L18 [Rhodogorgon sp.]